MVKDQCMTHLGCRFPGQEHVAGSAKIPSVMLYDSNGDMMAAGAETSLDENIERCEDEKWTVVEWHVIL